MEYAEQMEGVDKWEEWEPLANHEPGTEDPLCNPIRSEKEEKYLWAVLKELDRETHRQEKREQARKLRVIAKARKKMGVGKSQLGIKEMFHNKQSSMEAKQVIVSQSRLSSVQQPSLASFSMQTMGGPCHHYGGGAPPEQINTRARGHISLKPETSPTKECENVCQKNFQNSVNVLNESMSVAELSKKIPENENVITSNGYTNYPSFASSFENLGCRPKVRFNVKNCLGGRFNLEVVNGGPASSKSCVLKEENSANYKKTALQRKPENDNKHSSEVKVNHSWGQITPIKRKITEEMGGGVGEVQTLVCIFESDLTKPTWRGSVESPAKRQRCGRQGWGQIN